MMLRDEAVVAVDEVVLACREAARAYQDAAGMVDDPALEACFGALASERAAMACELESHIRRMGDLPSEPDPDRGLVATAVRHLKAALTSDEELTLLREREHGEDALAQHVAAALERPVPEDTRLLLEEHRRLVAAAQERLARARVATTARGAP
jgi:uncharacterized protein (TIGR02284 family)